MAARTFTAPVGVIFNTVRADRVADFETLIGHLQTALARSTDPTVQAQAKGWRVLKAAEPGPSGAVLYVFMLDPTVPKAEYGIGQILAEAYPDPTQLREIWKLYTSSVTGGGSLLNLSPVDAPAPVADAPAVAATTLQPESVAPAQPRMMPPDRDAAPRR